MRNSDVRKLKRNYHAEYLTANYTFNELCRFDGAIPPIDDLKREYRRNKKTLAFQQTA